jgi:hypothetical protein
MGENGRSGVPPGSSLPGGEALMQPPSVACASADWWDPAWDAAWWDPVWTGVRSAVTAEAAPATGGAAGSAEPRIGAGGVNAGPDLQPAGPGPQTSPPAQPRWGQVLATTFSLWISRRHPGRLPWPGRQRRRRSALGWGPASSPVSAVRRLPARLLAASVLGAGLLAVGAGTAGLLAASGSPTLSVRPVARPSPVAVPTERTVTPVWLTAVRHVARPVSLTIPAIGVRAQIVDLGLNPGGTIQVPATTTVAGWYTGSPQPGAIGPAVILGHVDSRSGPGIFFWLRTLRPGQRIYVGRADGTMAVFTVTRVQLYAKDQFPTAAVYGPVPDAELRLITCGGTFDQARGSYLSNVVVYARLAG